jgi:hypothetical protein
MALDRGISKLKRFHNSSMLKSDSHKRLREVWRSVIDVLLSEYRVTSFDVVSVESTMCHEMFSHRSHSIIPPSGCHSTADSKIDQKAIQRRVLSA